MVRLSPWTPASGAGLALREGSLTPHVCVNSKPLRRPARPSPPAFALTPRRGRLRGREQDVGGHPPAAPALGPAVLGAPRPDRRGDQIR